MTVLHGYRLKFSQLGIAIKIGFKLHNRLFSTTAKKLDPWCHWIVDDFLTADCLRELKSVQHNVTQNIPGRRVGSGRLFINHEHSDVYPNLYALWQSLHHGFYRQYFEHFTGLDYSKLFPRVEVVSDIGEFYLDPHPDQPEKRLTALIYTDHEQLYPGTALSDGSRVESKDNRCFFFVPAADTIHSYPRTTFEQVRRCLQINYWTYSL
jgi:hypothetical protein